ncbi:MAG: PAS domain-containing protein [Alphaproteobacteria bacterium]|nr:PAS domain-containing protein [Alphaproteobacteria bacterium]
MGSVSLIPDLPPARTHPGDWTWPLAPALAQAALEQAPTIIYIYDVQAGKSIFQNRPFGQLLGYAPDGGNDWQRFIHPEDAAAFPKHHQKLMSIQPGEVLTWHFRMRDVKGDWQHFLSRDVLLETDDTGAPRLIVGNASNITDQKAAEERKNLLLGEMRHRARNLVTLIDALGRQSMPRDNAAVAQFFDAFMGRMRALLETAETVLSSEQRMADLRAVAEKALAPFVNGENPRVRLQGPPVFVGESAAANLALVLHELATNATKYGALSGASGAVCLQWSVAEPEGARRVALEWRETAGPEVKPPTRQGYGTRVIRNALRGSDTDVALNFEPEGVHCRIAFALPQQS